MCPCVGHRVHRHACFQQKLSLEAKADPEAENASTVKVRGFLPPPVAERESESGILKDTLGELVDACMKVPIV